MPFQAKAACVPRFWISFSSCVDEPVQQVLLRERLRLPGARLSADGCAAGSAADGKVATDIDGGTNAARNIVLQPDGAIVVSGESFGTFTGPDHTDVVRYRADGSLDTVFGAGGALTLSGARVGEGLALQVDGKHGSDSGEPVRGEAAERQR